MKRAGLHFATKRKASRWRSFIRTFGTEEHARHSCTIRTKLEIPELQPMKFGGPYNFEQPGYAAEVPRGFYGGLDFIPFSW